MPLATHLLAPRPTGLIRNASPRASARNRQHYELASRAPGPSLNACTVPPCISTSRPDQYQADPQPAVRPVTAAVEL